MYRYMQVSYDKHVILMTTRTPVPQTRAANHPSEGARQAAAQRGKARRHLGPRATAPYLLISSSALLALRLEATDRGKGLLSSRGAPQRKAAHSGSLVSPRRRRSAQPRRTRPPPLTAPGPRPLPASPRRGHPLSEVPRRCLG